MSKCLHNMLCFAHCMHKSPKSPFKLPFKIAGASRIKSILISHKLSFACTSQKKTPARYLPYLASIMTVDTLAILCLLKEFSHVLEWSQMWSSFFRRNLTTIENEQNHSVAYATCGCYFFTQRNSNLRPIYYILKPPISWSRNFIRTDSPNIAFFLN